MRFPPADAPLIAHGFGGAGSYTEGRPVRLTNMARRPVQNAERQANARRSLYCGDRRHISNLETLEHAPDRCRQVYFSNTFSICPTFFSTLPAFFSALPLDSRLGLFVTLPAVSLTLPFTS